MIKLNFDIYLEDFNAMLEFVDNVSKTQGRVNFDIPPTHTPGATNVVELLFPNKENALTFLAWYGQGTGETPEEMFSYLS